MRLLWDMGSFRVKFVDVVHGVSSDVAVCRPEAEVSQLSKSSMRGNPAESVEIHLSEQSPLLLENENSSDVREEQQPEDEAVRPLEDRRNENEEEFHQGGRGGGEEVSSSPQFCSRHQRWVKNILRGCLDDCSEELLHQTDASSSPVLFQSSSSTSSSQDLTPSDLVPSPTHQLPSQSSTSSQASKPTNTGEESSSGSPGTNDPSQREPPTKTTPPLLSPVVRLVDITSCWRRHQHFFSNHATVFIPEQTSPLSLRCESGSKDSMFVLAETHPNMQTSSVGQDVSEQSSRQPPAQQTWSKLSRKFRRACASSRASQDLTNKCTAEQFVTITASFPTSCTASAESPQQVDSQNSDKSPPETHDTKPASHLPVSSSSSLQPYVRVTRLSAQECRRATQGRASSGREEADERTKEMQDTDSSFDVNILYSSGSSSSDWEDWSDPDPDYRPHIKKKRLMLEYESARTLKQTWERGNVLAVVWIFTDDRKKERDVTVNMLTQIILVQMFWVYGSRKRLYNVILSRRKQLTKLAALKLLFYILVKIVWEAAVTFCDWEYSGLCKR